MQYKVCNEKLDFLFTSQDDVILVWATYLTYLLGQPAAKGEKGSVGEGSTEK